MKLGAQVTSRTRDANAQARGRPFARLQSEAGRRSRLGARLGTPFRRKAVFRQARPCFRGGPCKPGLANDLIYLSGWPPVLAVHVMLGLALFGLGRHLRMTK